MKCKSPKLILGIILLVIAVIVWLTNPTSYWIAIALAAIGLILIISGSSKEEVVEPTSKEEVVEPTKKEEIPAVPTEKVVESVETPVPTEENTEEVKEEKKF
ncbi:hypothetical protein B6D52_02410 [Candidatus Parcubacteria bacterium 4484_255]|nr:MAG: hypothetical protein B6D52_02410 [Candidatus Parcubacteria bacterium 4484_255]